jgi:hypothetical protein
MQGENLESAREEIGRDQVARTPRPRTGFAPALAHVLGLVVRVLLVIAFILIVSPVRTPRNPLNWDGHPDWRRNSAAAEEPASVVS